MIKAIRKLFVLDITPEEKLAFKSYKARSNVWRMLVPLPIIVAMQVQNLYLFYEGSPAVTTPYIHYLAWIMLAVCAFFAVHIALLLRGKIRSPRAEEWLTVSFWGVFIVCMMFFSLSELQSKHTSYNFFVTLLAVAVIPLFDAFQVMGLLTASTTVYLLIARGIFRDPFHVQVVTCMEIADVVISQMIYIGAKNSFILRMRLKEQSERDVLTGLLNRRGMEDRLIGMRGVSAGTGVPIGVMMIDVDYFKNFNDTYGHVYGDYCLKKIADFIKGYVGEKGGIAVRYGGEEVAVYVPATDMEVLLRYAGEIKDRVHAMEMSTNEAGGTAHITVSVGVDLYVDGQDDTTAQALNRADKSLYIAKEDGRDRVAADGATVLGPG